MGSSIFRQQHMRAEWNGTTYNASSDGTLTLPLPDTITSELRVWFFPAEGYEFTNKGGSRSDSMRVHYGDTAKTVITIFGNGTNSLAATIGIALNWDSGYSNNGQSGAYLMTVSVSGYNSSYWYGGTDTANTMNYQLTQEQQPKSYGVSWNLNHCTVTPQPGTVTENQEYTLTFAADSGYQFNVQPTVSWTDSTGQVVTNDAVNGVVTFTPTDVDGTITVSATADAEQVEPVTYSVSYDVTNCTVSPRPETVTDGQTYRMTFTLAVGYEFDAQPVVSWNDNVGQHQRFEAVNGVVTFTPSNVQGTINVYATAVKSTPITEGYGIVNVYKVSDSNLTTIAQYGISSGQEVNLTQYIASLRKFFVPIEGEGSIKLVLGGYDTGDSVPQVTNDIAEFDCGSIEVKGLYSNALDYNSTTVEFWLPFIGVVDVASEKVMDSTVSLLYRVNVLSGDCIAILSVGGLPVATGTGNCTYEVPYNSQDNYNISSALSVSAQYLLDLTPFAIVRENTMIETERVDGAEWVRLGDMSGFTALDDFDVTGIQCTITESNMIRNYIESGVIV